MINRMDDELRELAKRFVENKHWAWWPGMGFDHHDGRTGRLLMTPLGEKVCVIIGEFRGLAKTMVPLADILPDPMDPGTYGCLIALLRTVFQDDMQTRRVSCQPNKWAVVDGDGNIISEAEGFYAETMAILFALEAKQ